MTDTIEQYKNVGMAAAYLSEQLQDKTPEQYKLLLNSSRVKSRAVAYRIPYEKLSGGIIYRVDELDKYIALQKSRTMGTVKLSTRAAEALKAVGFGEAAGSSTGRKFNITGINPQVDEATGEVFIQIITRDPLMVYRLEIEEAKAIAQELTGAIGFCERAVKK